MSSGHERYFTIYNRVFFRIIRIDGLLELVGVDKVIRVDGFIEFFKRKYDCRLGCRDCHYCDDWVETAVRFEGDALAYSGRITKTLTRYEQGAFRHRSGF